MRRTVLLAIIALVVLVILLFAAYSILNAASVPQQPIAFSHKNHASDRQIQCGYCHRNAAVGYVATLPPLETCMGCHRSVGGTSDFQIGEIAKIRAYYAAQQPVDWVRVTYIPDHVVFAHRPHIANGIQCTDCHARGAPPERWFTSFAPGMAWCTTCHSQRNASTDCYTCHK